MNKTNKEIIQNYKEYYKEINIDEIIVQSSLKLYQSGRYNFNSKNAIGLTGYFNTNRVTGISNTSYFSFQYNIISFNYNSFRKGLGLSVRCVAKALG